MTSRFHLRKSYRLHVLAVGQSLSTSVDCVILSLRSSYFVTLAAVHFTLITFLLLSMGVKFQKSRGRLSVSISAHGFLQTSQKDVSVHCCLMRRQRIPDRHWLYCLRLYLNLTSYSFCSLNYDRDSFPMPTRTVRPPQPSDFSVDLSFTFMLETSFSILTSNV